MTVKEAMRSLLEEWAKSPDFNLDDAQSELEQYVFDVVDDFAEANGYVHDEASCGWMKK